MAKRSISCGLTDAHRYQQAIVADRMHLNGGPNAPPVASPTGRGACLGGQPHGYRAAFASAQSVYNLT